MSPYFAADYFDGTYFDVPVTVSATTRKGRIPLVPRPVIEDEAEELFLVRLL